MPISVWKWEDISMDFIMGLPRTTNGYNSIWVIVDRLTKSAHFIPMKISYSARKYAEIYLDRIVTLHGVLLTIISDRGSVLSLASRSNSRSVLELVSSAVQLITPRLMAKQKG